MKVGILIPTYNRKDYLRLTLASALGQAHRDLEVIVIDNGSNDGTAEDMAVVGDSRVRYIVNEQNLGLLGSINKGIGLFSEEVLWCTILPDDDLLDCQFVGSMLQFIDKNHAQSIVHSHRLVIDEDGNTTREARLAPPVESSFEYICNRANGERETFLTGVFFSRKTFDTIGGYPQFTTGMSTDDAFIFALTTKDGLYFNRDAVAYVRVHPGAESYEVFGVARHIRAIGEFVEYVIAVARERHGYSNDELSRLKKIMRRYTRFSNSELWLRNVVPILKRKNHPHSSELPELFEMACSNAYPFSNRIAIDAFCLKTFRYCPEGNKLYRFFWTILNKFKPSK